MHLDFLISLVLAWIMHASFVWTWKVLIVLAFTGIMVHWDLLSVFPGVLLLIIKIIIVSICIWWFVLPTRIMRRIARRKIATIWRLSVVISAFTVSIYRLLIMSVLFEDFGTCPGAFGHVRHHFRRWATFGKLSSNICLNTYYICRHVRNPSKWAHLPRIILTKSHRLLLVLSICLNHRHLRRMLFGVFFTRCIQEAKLGSIRIIKPWIIGLLPEAEIDSRRIWFTFYIHINLFFMDSLR